MQESGKALIAGKTEAADDSYDYDENDHSKKEISAEEIKKQGLYEVPEKLDEKNDEGEGQNSSKDRGGSSASALRQGLYEVPENEEDETEELTGSKMKEEDGRRRNGGMNRGEFQNPDEKEASEDFQEAENFGKETQPDEGAVEQYKDSEVLDYAKKFKGKGRVVLDFSKGKENAKIIVYKYGRATAGPNMIEERAESKLDRRRSEVSQKDNSMKLEMSTKKKAVIRKYKLNIWLILIFV